jgi:hypothetical protein
MINHLKYTLLFLLPLITFSQSDSIEVTGTLINSYTNKSLGKQMISFNTDRYGFNSIAIITDEKGVFRFTSPVKEVYSFSLDPRKYVRKRSSFSHEYVLNKQIVIYARPLSDSKLVSDIDTTVIGMKVNLVIKQQKLRDTDIIFIQEPPGKYRGIRFLDNTANEISLYINRDQLKLHKIPRGPHRQEKILKQIKKLKIKRLLIWHP